MHTDHYNITAFKQHYENFKIYQLCNNVIYSNDLRIIKYSFDKLIFYLCFNRNNSILCKDSCSSSIHDMIEHTLINSINIHSKYSKFGKHNVDPSFVIITHLRNLPNNKNVSNTNKILLHYLAYVDEQDDKISNFIFSVLKIRLMPL